MGDKVVIASDKLPNYKKIFGKVGVVVDLRGSFVVVDYEHLKDLMYIHYQDLRRAPQ